MDYGFGNESSSTIGITNCSGTSEDSWQFDERTEPLSIQFPVHQNEDSDDDTLPPPVPRRILSRKGYSGIGSDGGDTKGTAIESPPSPLTSDDSIWSDDELPPTISTDQDIITPSARKSRKIDFMLDTIGLQSISFRSTTSDIANKPLTPTTITRSTSSTSDKKPPVVSTNQENSATSRRNMRKVRSMVDRTGLQFSSFDATSSSNTSQAANMPPPPSAITRGDRSTSDKKPPTVSRKNLRKTNSVWDVTGLQSASLDTTSNTSADVAKRPPPPSTIIRGDSSKSDKKPPAVSRRDFRKTNSMVDMTGLHTTSSNTNDVAKRTPPPSTITRGDRSTSDKKPPTVSRRNFRKTNSMWDMTGLQSGSFSTTSSNTSDVAKRTPPPFTITEGNRSISDKNPPTAVSRRNFRKTNSMWDMAGLQSASFDTATRNTNDVAKRPPSRTKIARRNSICTPEDTCLHRDEKRREKRLERLSSYPKRSSAPVDWTRYQQQLLQQELQLSDESDTNTRGSSYQDPLMGGEDTQSFDGQTPGAYATPPVPNPWQSPEIGRRPSLLQSPGLGRRPSLLQSPGLGRRPSLLQSPGLGRRPSLLQSDLEGDMYQSTPELEALAVDDKEIIERLQRLENDNHALRKEVKMSRSVVSGDEDEAHVDVAHVDVAHAEEVAVENGHSKVCGRSKKVFWPLLCLGAVVLAAAGIFAGYHLLRSGEASQTSKIIEKTSSPSTILPAENSSNAPTPTPTSFPTTPMPTGLASTPPTSSHLGALIDVVMPGTPLSDLDTDSYQYLALEWIGFSDPRTQPIFDSKELQERFSLVVLYYSTSGRRWNDNSLWLSGEHHCDWHSIKCDEGKKVIEIDLSRNGLNGKLATELGNLKGLQHCLFNENDLRGTIPSELGQTALTTLQLSENDLGGEIPSELGDLEDLQSLDVSINYLADGIPSEIGRLTSLRELILSRNVFKLALPSEIGQLSKLEVLNLNDNFLESAIPSEIGAMSALLELHVQDNRLSGSLPTTIGSLGQIVLIDFGTNDIRGPIPSEIGRLTNLTMLSLNRNMLTGTIPTQIGHAVALKDIVFHSNRISGKIPSEMGELSDLTQLSLWSNKLTGRVPAELEELSLLEAIYLDNNDLRGGLEGLFCNSTQFDSTAFDFVADCGGSSPDLVCACCSKFFFDSIHEFALFSGVLNEADDFLFLFLPAQCCWNDGSNCEAQ
eukprot:scaffold2619_cov129-Cylindrotheca_fusiformis.AAC.9